MKIVIDIPEEYRALYETEKCKSKFDSLATNEFGYVLRKAFENGTPLPKGHGDLVDRKDLSLMTIHMIDGTLVCDAPTIIEADTTRDCETCGHSSGGKCAYTEECHDCMWESKYIEADREGEHE